MKTVKCLLFVLISVFLPMKLSAQDAWMHLDGLPCEEVASIIQGDDGYIWIGTRLGLFRYDGYTIKTYRNDLNRPFAFSSCNISSLATDRQGNIYTGSFFGLNTLDLETQDIGICHIEGSDNVHSLLYDQGDRLWVGTENGLYLKTNDGGMTHYRQIPRDLILDLCQTTFGLVIVATRTHGLFQIDANNRCNAIQGTREIHPRSVYGGRRDTLWIGTNQKGLFSLCKGHLLAHGVSEGMTVNDIISNPADNQLIIATDIGIVSYPISSHPLALKGMRVKSLCMDNCGNIWAATETDGVYWMPKHGTSFSIQRCSFTHNTSPIASQFHVRSLNDTTLWSTIPQINAIYETSNSTTWIGTENRGIYVVRHGKICNNFTAENTAWLKTNTIYSFCTLDKEQTLVASWYGLYMMTQEGRGHFIGQIGKSDISTMHTLSINALADNDVWLGLVGGIAHVEGRFQEPEKARITLYTHVNKAGMKDVKDIGKITDIHDEQGKYQLGGIYRICKDTQGRIWACTSEPGLLKYDAEKDLFRSVSGEMGILGDNVHSMEQDQYGNFWMTTNYGILQMSIDKKGNVSRRQLYTNRDGLPTSYYGSTASTQLDNGLLCFLHQQRLITVSPNQEFGIPVRQRTYISDISVNGAEISASNAEVDAMPPFTQKLVLSHDNNNITLRLTSLSFGNESSIHYSYRLEGMEDDCQQTDMGSNVIRYSQLPPGSYTLHYCSLNGNGEDGEYRQLKIEVLQPLWWRWWAKLLYAVVLLLSICMIGRNVIAQRRKQRQLEMLEIEKRQQEELYQKKTQFYTKAFHEFLLS